MPLRRCTSLLALSLPLLLAACAAPPLAPALPPTLLEEEAEAGGVSVPTAGDIFALSTEMRAYAERELQGVRQGARAGLDARRELIRALYDTSGLRLSYDNATTLNAAQAFDARAGNCLSLVIMTAAFARYLGLPVAYQQVETPGYYSRNGSLVMESGHVNLVLEAVQPRLSRTGRTDSGLGALTVDFLLQYELRGQRSRAIDESRVVAMFLNNRAVEHLRQGRLVQALAHARAALRADGDYLPAVNTLGVLLKHAGRLDRAESAFRHLLARDPKNVHALSNLQLLLRGLGQVEEAEVLGSQLARLQPVAPFQRLMEGREAYAAGNVSHALALFRQELDLQPYQDEVHFWVALAYLRLGETQRAESHLAWAAEYSASRGAHDRYAAKLAHLRGTRLQ